MVLSYWGKKNISEWIRFSPKPWKSHFLVHFLDFLSPPCSSQFLFKNLDPTLSYFMMSNFMGKNQKKMMIWRSCSADGWRDKQSKIYWALLLGWVSSYFLHQSDIKDFQLQYDGTFLRGGIMCITRHQLGVKVTKMATK